MTDIATNDKDGPFHVHILPQFLKVGKRLGVLISSMYLYVLCKHEYIHVYMYVGTAVTACVSA